MKIIRQEGLPFAKYYNYHYYGLKCIQHFSFSTKKNLMLFKEGYIYPILCSSLDLYGTFDTSKRMSLISQNGYKIDFSPNEITEYFEVEALYHFIPKLF